MVEDPNKAIEWEWDWNVDVKSIDPDLIRAVKSVLRNTMKGIKKEKAEEKKKNKKKW